MKKGVSFPPMEVTAEISIILNEPVSPDPEASGTFWAKVTGVALHRSHQSCSPCSQQNENSLKEKERAAMPTGSHHLSRHLQEQSLEQKRGPFVYAFPCAFIYSVKDIFKLVTLTLKKFVIHVGISITASPKGEDDMGSAQLLGKT